MNGKKVEEIERAIGTLTQEELEELRLRLDEYGGRDRSIAASRRIWRRANWTRLCKARWTMTAEWLS